MRVYVAASSQEIERARAAMQSIRELGLEVAYDWTADLEGFRLRGLAEHQLSDAEQLLQASRCLDALSRSDVLWLLAPSTQSRGAWVELGQAIRDQMPIVVSGPDRRASVFGALATVSLESDSLAPRLFRELAAWTKSAPRSLRQSPKLRRLAMRASR